jgi:hypothetical protein
MHTIKFETDVMSPYIKFDAYQSFMNQHVEVWIKQLDCSLTRQPYTIDFKDYLRSIPKLDEPLNLERNKLELVFRDVFA